MSKMKFELNSEGVVELLQSEAMESIVKEYAIQIMNKCGEGYDFDTHMGEKRVNAMVWADSFKAKWDNKKNNTLLKSVK